jgi:hypothetical protein
VYEFGTVVHTYVPVFLNIHTFVGTPVRVDMPVFNIQYSSVYVLCLCICVQYYVFHVRCVHVLIYVVFFVLMSCHWNIQLQTKYYHCGILIRQIIIIWKESRRHVVFIVTTVV